MSTSPNHTLYHHQEKHRLPEDSWLLKEKKRSRPHDTRVLVFQDLSPEERRANAALTRLCLDTVASTGNESPC